MAKRKGEWEDIGNMNLTGRHEDKSEEDKEILPYQEFQINSEQAIIKKKSLLHDRIYNEKQMYNHIFVIYINHSSV